MLIIISIESIIRDMEYTFRSPEKTVYLELPYKLVINSSSGVALENGKSSLTASVVRTSDGSVVDIDDSAFSWSRRELSEDFEKKTGPVLNITKEDLVNGAGTFICTCKPEEFYWTDTAFITIEETIAGTAGENAPYQRFIFHASKEKPNIPEGTCESVPAEWNLVVPPRLSDEKIWVSSGYVSFVNNEPIYSEWSEPAEWSGTSVLPIVQWQWGESSDYPPHVTSYAILVDGELLVFGNTMFIDDFGEWTEKIPDKPDNMKFLWKREYNWQHTSTDDEWIYYLAQGPQGLVGSYQGLGWYIVGTNTVFFMGLDEDKSPTLSTIHIFIGGRAYYFNSISASLSNKSDTFYLVATLNENGFGGLGVYYLKFVSDGTNAETQWLSYDTDERITDGYVLAEIRMDGYAIESVSIIEPKRLSAYEKVSFMEILNGRDMDDINAAAEALGIERVFTRVAALEAFIDSLLANEAFIKQLTTENFTMSYGRMRVRIGVFSGTPMFIAEYINDDGQYETIFYMHFSSDNIFFGRPNSSYSAPSAGFMYRASDQTIVGVNNRFSISSSGALTARSANISGTINATSGTMKSIVIDDSSVFNGILQAASIFTREGTEDDEAIIYSASINAENILTAINNAIGVDKKRFYPCSIVESGFEDIKYLYVNSFNADGLGDLDPSWESYSMTFYDGEKNPIQIEDYGITLKRSSTSGIDNDTTYRTTGDFTVSHSGGIGAWTTQSLYSPSLTLYVYMPQILLVYVPTSDTGEGLEDNQVYKKSDGTLMVKISSA